MTTPRDCDSPGYQVDKIPPYLLSCRVTRVYAFSQARYCHSHTKLRIKYLIEFFQNINSMLEISLSSVHSVHLVRMRGERQHIEDPLRGEVR